MIDGGLLPSRPLQEVVEFCLKLPVLGVPPGGPVVERLAQEADPMVGQAAAGPSIPGSAALAVVQL